MRAQKIEIGRPNKVEAINSAYASTGISSLASQASRDQPTVIAGYAMAIAKTLDHYGVDSRRLLLESGIGPVLGNDPLQRLPAPLITRLYSKSVEATNDPYFGLAVGRFVHASNLHAFGHGLAASATLMDFCRRLERFFQIAAQSAHPIMSAGDREVEIRMRMQAQVCGERQDALVCFLIKSMRQLYKASFKPVKVGLAHACPEHGAAPYEAICRSPVLFDQPAVFIVFSRADLEAPLSGACAELARINDQVATEYLARLDKDDVLSRVRHAIVTSLSAGTVSRDVVAESLCVSAATLRRRLAARGTSFQSLLDETRKEIACVCMSHDSKSVTQVALDLGFTDNSNFTRAFKKWTGLSPRRYRQSVRMAAARQHDA